jgi:hypothetical protein|tara:strand:- start:1268 stop:1885 length:618 start_codon:yes stop_codon:yes gene_type:complete
MKHLLSSSAFLVLNKKLAKEIGLKEAVLLADLISKEEYFIANGMTDGWFFNTEANIEADTTLNSYHQRKCLKMLKKHKIIETKRKGIPAKQYFKINEQQVLQILNNLSAKNSTTINKNKEIKIINKYFKKPSILEVKNYCNERQNQIDEESFINFYDSKGWMVGKNKMKDWKAAIRTWEMRKNNTKDNTTSHRHQKGQDYGDGTF